MKQLPSIPPRISLFLEILIERSKQYKEHDAEFIEYFLGVFWNEILLPREREKVMEYKHESRAKAYIGQLCEKYRIDDILNDKDEMFSILYSTHGVPATQENIQMFQKQYDVVYAWFEWEYQNVFQSDRLKKTILADQKHFSVGGLSSDIMMQILMSADDLNTIQPFMRAYQSLDNHYYYIFQDKVFSKFSWDMVRSLLSYSPVKIDDIYTVYLPEIYAAYKHISAFFAWEKQDNEDAYKERCVYIDSLDIDTDRKKQVKKDFEEVYICTYHPEYTSIIRHCFDWAMRIVPDILYKKESIKIFASIVIMVHTLHSRCGAKFIPRGFQYISEDSLKKYILREKKSANIGSIRDSASGVLDDLLYMIPDEIEPLFFFPVMKTQKQEEELMRSWKRLKETTRNNY